MEYKETLQEILEKVEKDLLLDKEKKEIKNLCSKIVREVNKRSEKSKMSMSIALWFNEKPTIKGWYFSKVYDNYCKFCDKFAMKAESSNALSRAIHYKYGIKPEVTTINGKSVRTYK